MKKKKTGTMMIILLPVDVLLDCIARMQRHKYSTLSSVCKLFRSIVTSPELYSRRSLLGCTETCIYVPTRKFGNTSVRWYTVNLTTKCLVHIPSLPPMPFSSWGRGRGYVVVGSRIFCLGGNKNKSLTTDVSTIDCRYDLAKPFGNMPKTMLNGSTVSKMDRKIYVIGDSDKESQVLEIEAQKWEYPEEEKTMISLWLQRASVVMDDDKIYNRCYNDGFVFEPKGGNKCEVDKFLTSGWRGGAKGCVIEGMLYSYDTSGNCLRAYDIKKRLSCGVVKGVEGLIKGHCVRVSVASCGNKKLIILLALKEKLFQRKIEIWCAEIALLGRNHTGEMMGKVEWFQLLLDEDVRFLDCLSVIV